MNKVMGILMLLVYICVATTLLSSAFVSPFNMQNIVRWSAFFGIIGIGVAFVIITGGIDLSIGSLIGLVGCLLPMFLVKYEWSILVSLLAVMVVSLAVGLLHGLLITKMRLQPFVVTLCGLLFYRGLARWLTGDQTQGFGIDYEDSLRLLATGKPCSVAFVMLMAGLLVVAWFLWRLVAAKRRPPEERSLAVNVFGLLGGVALAVIGSSRFWHGFEFTTGGVLFSLGGLDLRSWRVTVPDAGAELPSQLMRHMGWIAVAGLVWFQSLGMRHDWKRMLAPPAALLLAACFVWGVMRIVALPDERFWPGAEWAAFWKMPLVFLSLAALMAALAWYGRSGLRAVGPASRLPLAVSGGAGILWLLGGTPLGQTLVPAPMFVLMAIAAAAAVFLNLTIYGRYLLALGRNEEAARYSGINTDRMVILAYVLCSTAAGVGGILFALDGNSVQPSGHGNFYELYAIAAAVLGGCSLRGGEGSILGVMIGAAVMRVLYNSINLLGIPSQLEFAIIGMVILLGVMADEIVERIAARRRAAAEAPLAPPSPTQDVPLVRH